MSNYPHFPRSPKEFKTKVNTITFSFKFFAHNYKILVPLIVVAIMISILFNTLGSIFNLSFNLAELSKIVEVGTVDSLLEILTFKKLAFTILGAILQLLLTVVFIVFINFLVNIKTNSEDKKVISELSNTKCDISFFDAISSCFEILKSKTTASIVIKSILYNLFLFAIVIAIALPIALFVNIIFGSLILQICNYIIPILVVGILVQRNSTFGKFLQDFKGLFKYTGGELFNFTIFIVFVLITIVPLNLIIISIFTSLINTVGLSYLADIINPLFSVVVLGISTYFFSMSGYFLTYFYYQKIDLVSDK